MVETFVLGFASAVVGAGAAYGALKARINFVEKKLNKMSNTVVYTNRFDEFKERFNSLEQHIYALEQKIENLMIYVTNLKK